MADRCFSAFKACRIRAVRLDACGRPVVGPNSVGVSKGFISVGASADIEDGEEFTVKNACGELCINEKDCSQLKRYNLTLTFCQVDPSLLELMTSSRALTDAVGDVKGIAIGSTIDCDTGFSLELWQKITNPECETGAEVEWNYVAFPFATGGIIGDFTFENGPFQFDVTAYTKEVGVDRWNALPGTGLGNVGPFAVLPTSAALLNPEHVGMFLTNVQPPEPTCGLTAFPAAP